VLGDAGGLGHNHEVVWSQYLDAEFGAGRYADGLKLLGRAAAAMPGVKEFREPAGWVTRAARRKADVGGWAAGLAAADEGLKLLAGDDAKAVRGWKDAGRRQWSQD